MKFIICSGYRDTCIKLLRFFTQVFRGMSNSDIPDEGITEDEMNQFLSVCRTSNEPKTPVSHINGSKFNRLYHYRKRSNPTETREMDYSWERQEKIRNGLIAIFEEQCKREEEEAKNKLPSLSANINRNRGSIEEGLFASLKRFLYSN